MLYHYEYLMQIFPGLTDFVYDFESLSDLQEDNNSENIKEEYDRVKDYLTKEEYSKLHIDERNQLALDNYIKGNKKKWQIGRDYELFCGHLYENAGWNVEYHGMEKKLEDMGIDLIARHGNKVHIVQCKYWSQRKKIHEKHIFQLFGTTKVREMECNDMFTEFIPVFMTNISLSKKAKQVAKLLKITVATKDFKEFPRIKCNIGMSETGEQTKIYHLPFDQQYDRTKIKNGEGTYALTVEKAVEMGYRRAFKYRGIGTKN